MVYLYQKITQSAVKFMYFNKAVTLRYNDKNEAKESSDKSNETTDHCSWKYFACAKINEFIS